MDRQAFAHETCVKHRDEIIQVMQDLVRIPSQNTPPGGEEGRCQAYIAGYLRQAGLAADVYEPDQVPGLVQHEAFWPGRDYRARPNVSSLMPGCGGGRSLLITGHCDTVPQAEGNWTKAPLGGEIDHGRLYGLGSIDMKGPLAALLVLFKAVAESGIVLGGALAFESVVDEEFGGVNGTIAGRLRNGPMDGAVIAEGTNLQIYPAARGLLISNLAFRSAPGIWPAVGPTEASNQRANVIEQIGILLSHLDELRAMRRAHPVHPLYSSYPDPAPLEVTKVYAGGWGSQVPVTIPAQGLIELIVEALPGEDRAGVLNDQEQWLASVIERNKAAFATPPETRFHIRWMPPTAMDPVHPLVAALAGSVHRVTGTRPPIAGAPYACDLFALQRIFNMSAVVFGPSGGNAHAADEYLELDSLFTFWECLLCFVLDWCGVAE